MKGIFLFFVFQWEMFIDGCEHLGKGKLTKEREHFKGKGGTWHRQRPSLKHRLMWGRYRGQGGVTPGLRRQLVCRCDWPMSLGLDDESLPSHQVSVLIKTQQGLEM